KLFTLITLMLFSVLSAVTATKTYSNNDLSFTQTENGLSSVLVNGLTNQGTPGAPNLPVETIRLIIPAGSKISNLNLTSQQQLLSGSYNLEPAQVPRLIDGIGYYETVGQDRTIYSDNSFYPSNIVKVVSYDYFDGANKIATLEINPVQYNPITGEIKLHTNVSINPSFSASTDNIVYPQKRFAKDVAVYSEQLKSMVENPNDISLYGHQPQIITEPGVNDYDYLIVVPNDNYIEQTDLKKFIEWKEQKGNRVIYRTVGSIHSEYQGDHIGTHVINDKAGSIRQYIKDLYENHGLAYVLLVGDDSFFNRKGRSVLQLSNGTVSTEDISTNFYFADVNGDWNLNGSLVYGEIYNIENPLFGDNPDYAFEVSVGRLLIQDLNSGGAEEINNWVEKLLVYETNPGYGDNDYVNTMFITNADGVYEAGGSSNHQLLGDYLATKGLFFEKWDEVDDVGTFWPTGAEVIEKMSSGYGFIGFDTHGPSGGINTDMFVSTEGDGGNIGDVLIPRRSVTTLDQYPSTSSSVISETINGYDNFNNSKKYSINYSLSCNIANFSYLNTISAGKAFTVTANYGGSAFIGNTGNGLFEYSNYLQLGFFINLFASPMTEPAKQNHIGASLLTSSSYDTYQTDIKQHLLYTTNLIGDPEMMVWFSKPMKINIDYLANNEIRVTNNNSNLYGAVVVFENKTTMEKETKLTEIDGVCQASFNYTDIYVTYPNYEPYRTTIVKQNESWTIAKTIYNDVLVKSGATLSISGDLTLSNFAGKNARIIVENGGSLVFLGGADVIGTTKSYNITSYLEVPGNAIIVKQGGSIDFNHITFSGYWDGIVIENGNDLAFSGVSFNRTDLVVNMRNISFSQCSFIRSKVRINDCSVSIDNSDFHSSPVEILNLYESPRNLIVTNSEFSNSTNQVALNITGYSNFSITGSVISNNKEGLSIYESGTGSNHIISNNTITENTNGNGIYLYHSYADITGSNVIESNKYGITVVHNSNFKLSGNDNPPYQFIRYNDLDEVVFSYDSKPVEFLYNQIYDNNHTNKYLVCRDIPSMSQSINVRNNYWGTSFNASTDLSPTSMFRYSPTWIPSIVPPLSDDPAEQLFSQGLESESNGDLVSAESTYKEVIETYPESEYVSGAAKQLLSIASKTENRNSDRFLELKSYYLNEENLHLNDDISWLASELVSYCNVKSENYEEAIIWFESVISNPPSIDKQVYATIDLGYTYLIMDNNGRSKFVGKMTSLKPKSVADFNETRDKLLGDLYGETGENPEEISIPKEVTLYTNYPNPFNPETTISFSLPITSKINLSIYNVNGERIHTLLEGNFNGGKHSVVWNGKDKFGNSVGSGLYFYRLETDNKTLVKNCLLVK
ncbi:MAG: T9SS type A sorting domain-containing protein, partial [Candidatus Delongbacteria bacterium]|nr:T9SS type A sorting domain-containing protein [Candidatus Delongbacteria bacterium]MBN2833495.1 T9SS type A sorting domain-containing protein [Candidatus Delongbacteria bacterium]